MKINFGQSKQSTIGIEWELAIVDATTYEQVPGAPLILEKVDDPVNGPIRGEYLQSMVEFVTGVHQTVASAVAELEQLRDWALSVLEPRGMTLLGAGAHPFGDPKAQQPYEKPQYRRVSERNGWWGQQMAINGLHIHVGIDHKSKALPIVYGLSRFTPYFIALSASSPFWEGKDTRFASQRTMMFQQLPTNGLPYDMADWRDLESYASQLEGAGMIQNASEIRWDVRPSQWGTVENRLMDSVPTTMEIGAMAALSQTLVERMSQLMAKGESLDRLPLWFMRENKWRAARYGLAADIISVRKDEHIIHATDGILYWLDRLGSIAGELGCERQFEQVRQLVRGGPSYLRQRRVAASSGGDMRAVTRSVVEELRAGVPHFREAL